MSQTIWRFHRLFTLGRVFFGFNRLPWKMFRVAVSDTVQPQDPGHKWLTRNGRSLMVKFPPLPFEFIVGIWRDFRVNPLSDTDGVVAVSVTDGKGEEVPIDLYHDSVDKGIVQPGFVRK